MVYESIVVRGRRRNIMLEQLSRNWWTLLVRGIVAILLAVIAFSQPGTTVTALVWLWGAYALADGVFVVIASVRAAGQHQRWGMLLLQGLSGIAAGIIAFAWPAITALVLVYLIAAWAIVTGALEVAAAVQLRQVIKGEWLLALGGVLSVALGVLIAARPGAGLLAWVWVLGGFALLFGVLLLALAFRLRGITAQTTTETDTRTAPTA
jgi:uncharacterized membrane protein HdeD (DUF308 family)